MCPVTTGHLAISTPPGINPLYGWNTICDMPTRNKNTPRKATRTEWLPGHPETRRTKSGHRKEASDVTPLVILLQVKMCVSCNVQYCNERYRIWSKPTFSPRQLCFEPRAISRTSATLLRMHLYWASSSPSFSALRSCLFKEGGWIPASLHFSNNSLLNASFHFRGVSRPNKNSILLSSHFFHWLAVQFPL